MARYRKRRQTEIELTPMISIALLVLGIYLYQSEINTALLIGAGILAALLVGAVLHLIKRNKRELLSKSGIADIDKMSGIDFEKYLKALLERRGYTDIKLTPKYDLGVDLVAHKSGEAWAIQAKRYKGRVKLDAVRQVVTAANHYNCTRTMVITNSYFTQNARTIANSAGCVLIDRDELIKLALQTPSN